MEYYESHLLAQLKEGSASAFESLFQQYSGKLYHFVLRISSGDAYLAEEMVQRTFIKIWDHKENINPQKKFISYLCTIAKNMLINEYEHQTIEFVYRNYILSQEGNEVVNDNDMVSYTILEDFIDKVTQKLPPARREIFHLSHKSMLTNKEIAERLNLAESTVQTQLSKALEFMRKQLTEYREYIIILITYFIS